MEVVLAEIKKELKLLRLNSEETGVRIVEIESTLSTIQINQDKILNDLVEVKRILNGD